MISNVYTPFCKNNQFGAHVTLITPGGTWMMHSENLSFYILLLEY